MKNINAIIFLILLFIGCKNDAKNTFGNQKAPIENSKKQDSSNAIEVLKEFYTVFYGSETPTTNEKLQKKYISSSLIDKINSLRADGENLILDYDPFIQGQDYNYKTVIKTLNIKPLQNNNEYEVSFLQFGDVNEKETTIIYQMIKEKDGYKIKNILSDNILNPVQSNDTKKDYFVLASADVFENNTKYTISVLEKTENKNKTQHTLNPVIIYKDGKQLYENAHLIFSFDDDCPADGFQRIVSKNNFFTIEQVDCKDFLYAQSYTTFKIKNGRITLHKYGEEYTDRSNPEKDINSLSKTEKDFGNISFENVTEDFLRNLRQK